MLRFDFRFDYTLYTRLSEEEVSTQLLNAINNKQTLLQRFGGFIKIGESPSNNKFSGTVYQNHFVLRRLENRANNGFSNIKGSFKTDGNNQTILFLCVRMQKALAILFWVLVIVAAFQFIYLIAQSFTGIREAANVLPWLLLTSILPVALFLFHYNEAAWVKCQLKAVLKAQEKPII